MRLKLTAWLLVACVSQLVPKKRLRRPRSIATPQSVRHYVYFNTKRERIAERWFLESESFDGAQLKYRWPELEPEIDRYDFSSIRHDLALLRRSGKRLFIQLQDVSFDASIPTANPMRRSKGWSS